MVHIGGKIKQLVKERGLTVSEFARRINTSRENVYGIYKRKTLDTGLLLKINQVLQYDFFQSFQSGSVELHEDQEIYAVNDMKKSQLQELIGILQNDKKALKSQLAALSKELENLKEKYDELKEKYSLLKKVNELMGEGKR